MLAAKKAQGFRSLIPPARLAGAMRFESGEGPLHLTVVQRAPTDDEFNEYIEYMSRVVLCGEPIALVVDADLDGPALGIGQLRKIVEWMRSHRLSLAQRCFGYALIRRRVPAPVRFATSMMLSLLPVTPMPYRMFGDRAPAMRWIEQLIEGSASSHDMRSRGWSEPPPQ